MMDRNTVKNVLSHVRSFEGLVEAWDECGGSGFGERLFNEILLELVKEDEMPIDVVLEYLEVTQSDVDDCLAECME